MKSSVAILLHQQSRNAKDSCRKHNSIQLRFAVVTVSSVSIVVREIVHVVITGPDWAVASATYGSRVVA